MILFRASTPPRAPLLPKQPLLLEQQHQSLRQQDPARFGRQAHRAPWHGTCEQYSPENHSPSIRENI
jgi:hypothetical protein